MERYTVFDLEMPNRNGDRISAIGICIIENGIITEHYYSLVNPEAHFDKYTIKITGITPELVKDEPTFPEIWEEVRELFEDTVLVAHSVQGDMHVLSRCLQSYGILWTPTVSCACTLELGNLCYPDFVSHKLDAMCETLGIELDHHNAGSDAEGSAMLLLDYMSHGIDPKEHIVLFDTIKAHAAHKAKKPFPIAVNNRIKEELFEMQDEECRLIKLADMPLVSEDEIIGVPVSRIKQYSSELINTAAATEFMRLLPHDYLEEYDLHACILNSKKKFTSALELTKLFLPYIDNPETCDLLLPKAFRRPQTELKKCIDEWLESYRPFTVRFAVCVLMNILSIDGFDTAYLEKAAELDGCFDAVDSVLPLFFANVLLFRYDDGVNYFTEHRLSPAVHNKAIRKYLENPKAPKNRKAALKELLIK